MAVCIGDQYQHTRKGHAHRNSGSFQMKKPLVKSITQDENSLVLQIKFQENADYFDGHFENFSVLPGVVQIHYAMLCGQEYFNITPNVLKISKLKFGNIIRPETEVSLRINHIKGDNKLSFKYFGEDKVFSSGDIFLEKSA